MLALAIDPELTLGELCMNSRLTVGSGGAIAGLLELASLSLSNRPAPKPLQALRWLRRGFNPIHLANHAGRAKRHVAHH
jgi:hypothetical protein